MYIGCEKVKQCSESYIAIKWQAVTHIHMTAKSMYFTFIAFNIVYILKILFLVVKLVHVH